LRIILPAYLKEKFGKVLKMLKCRGILI